MTLLISFVLYIAASLLIKSRPNGRNIVGQQLPTWLDVICCASVCTPCCIMPGRVLLGVVTQSLKPVKLLATRKQTQQLPTLLQLLHPLARFFMLLKAVIRE